MPFAELNALRQACAQIWEQILFSSGGTLELTKCYWYIMCWQWTNGRPELAPNIVCPGIIALTSGRCPNYMVIPRLEVWDARRMLGVRPAPDGNFREEGKFLLNKGNRCGTRLSISDLTEMDTFIFHRSTYVPSMTYSLPLTIFDRKTLNQIQRWAIQAILNKLGVCRSFPQRVAFGPKELGGMSLLDMSIEQGIKQIKHLANRVFAGDSLGNMILIAL
jgi:hypothetical protein